MIFARQDSTFGSLHGNVNISCFLHQNNDENDDNISTTMKLEVVFGATEIA